MDYMQAALLEAEAGSIQTTFINCVHAKISRRKWSIAPSEALVLIAALRLSNCTAYVESGTAYGASLEYILTAIECKMLPRVTELYTVDLDPRRSNSTCSSLMLKFHTNAIRCYIGDGPTVIEAIVARSPDARLGIFVDGPKHRLALTFAASILKKPNVQHVCVHDVSPHWTGMKGVELYSFSGLCHVTFYSNMHKAISRLDGRAPGQYMGSKFSTTGAGMATFCKGMASTGT